MLFDPRYFPYWRNGCLLLTAFLLICAAYTYRVNARRLKDDPNKQDFHFGAILLAPIAWPLLLLGYGALLLIQVVLYSLFLFLVIFALVVIRKPFLLVWLDKIATKIGTKLLAANSQLIRALFKKQTDDSPI